jgi:hypothetical protein
MTTTTRQADDGRMRRGFGIAIAIAAIAALGIVTALHARDAGGGTGDHGATETAIDTATAVEADTSAAGPGETRREWVDRVLMGGPGAARAVALSPDGNRVLAVRDRGVDLWSVQGKRTGWLAISGDQVAGASWSPDGSRVIVWGGETVRLWNADTGAMIATLQAGMGVVAHAELLPDGERAVTLGADGTRRVWNLASGVIEAVERDAALPRRRSANDVDVDATTAQFYVDEHGDVRARRAL